MQSKSCISIIDPANRTGKISVPLNYICPTRGSQEYFESAVPKDLSLCLLFQKQRCNAGVKCHQIHVDRSFVDHVRQLSTGSNCCATHGDPSSAGFMSTNSTIALVQVDGSVRMFPLTCFGRTSLLDQVLRSPQPSKRISVNKICRLHSQAKCKFGKDCKNIHFCRDLNPAESVELPPTQPTATGFGIGNRSATVTPQPSVYHDDISDSSASETSSLCGASHQSSLRSTPAKGHNLLKPHVSQLPEPLTQDELDINDLLMKPLKQVSPQFGFCAEGFEASLRSLAEDIASIRISPTPETPTVSFGDI